MNQQQVMSVVRDLLQIVGTFLTTYGIFSQEQWQPIAGGLLMIAPVVWGMLAHTQANAIAVAAAIPDVAKVEVKPTPTGIALKDAAGSTPDALVTVAKI